MHYCYVVHEANPCRQFRIYPVLSVSLQNITDTADTSPKERH